MGIENKGNTVLDNGYSVVILADMKQRQPARKGGPAVTVRFRSKAELAAIKRAARIEGLSFNTFVVGRASVDADQVIKNNAAGEAIEEALTGQSQ